MTGEANRCLNKNHVFVGDWATGKLIIFDNSQLYGYGDGVFVQDDLSFVATGHHGTDMVEKIPTDPAWGSGHGLEIIDISVPEAPKRRSNLKLPKFYMGSPDGWDVQAVGKYVFVGDTKAGLFVVNASDPGQPSI